MNTEKNKQNFSVRRIVQNGNMIFLMIVPIIFSCSVLFLACGIIPKEKIDYNKIQKVKIGYLPEGINTNIQISVCDEIIIYEEVFKDTLIVDKKFFHSLTDCINKLKYSSKEVSYDFRIRCLILVEGDTIPQKLCMGGSKLITFNGHLMKGNNNLFNLINKTIYYH